MKALRAGTGQSVAQIDGRRVLQPACNRVVIGRETGRPMKKLHDLKVNAAASPALSLAREEADACSDGDQVVIASRPPLQTPKTVHRRSDDLNGLNSSAEKPASPSAALKSMKKSAQACAHVHPIPSLPAQQGKVAVPGSIAAAQREQATIIRAQRKMRIAHYGRTPGKTSPVDSSSRTEAAAAGAQDEKRCSFITSNSGTFNLGCIEGTKSSGPRILWADLLLFYEQIPSTSPTMTRNGECPSMMTSMLFRCHKFLLFKFPENTRLIS